MPETAAPAAEGDALGEDGDALGEMLGDLEGDALGEIDGLCEGLALGDTDGLCDGLVLGEIDGDALGDAPSQHPHSLSSPPCQRSPLSMSDRRYQLNRHA